jgi:hypothetical protein
MGRTLIVCCWLILLAACGPAQSQPSHAFVPVQIWNESQEYANIQLIDIDTGEKLKDFPTLSSTSSFLSPDGRKLVAIESNGQICQAYAGGSACYGNAGVLHMVDLSAWQDVTLDLSGESWASTAVFSSDAAYLALALVDKAKSTLMLLDTEGGKRLAEMDLEIHPLFIRFNQEGNELVIYGQAPGTELGLSKPPAPQALRIEVPSLRVLWQQSLEGITSGEWCEANCEASYEERIQVTWTPALAYAPEQHALHVVHPDEEQLTTVDLQAQQVRRTDIRKARSLLERLLALTAGVAYAKGPINGGYKEAALSPDGKVLYVIGQKFMTTRTEEGGFDFQKDFLGLQFVDPQTGQLVEQREGQAANLRITADGAYLFLTGTTDDSAWTEVISTGDRKLIMRLEGWEAVFTHRVDGQPAYVAVQYGPYRPRLAVLDMTTFQVARTWNPASYMNWIPASP